MFGPITIPFGCKMLFNTVKLKPGVDMDDVDIALAEMCSVVKETYGDDNLVLIMLGDHQPATIVSGQGASHDVPITIVAKDPAVLILHGTADTTVKPRNILSLTRRVQEQGGAVQAHYYAAYLLKTNGAAEEEWRPFAERTRQIFRFLAEHQEPGALEKYEARVAAEFVKTINK